MNTCEMGPFLQCPVPSWALTFSHVPNPLLLRKTGYRGTGRGADQRALFCGTRMKGDSWGSPTYSKLLATPNQCLSLLTPWVPLGKFLVMFLAISGVKGHAYREIIPISSVRLIFYIRIQTQMYTHI